MFFEILLTTSGDGILMTIVYSSPLWCLFLLYSIFNPSVAMVCILLCFICEFICFIAFGRIKFCVFSANNNLRRLMHVFNSKKTRNQVILYWQNPSNKPYKDLTEWFIAISNNTFVVLDPLEIDFSMRVIHKECAFYEDTFRRRAFCESWKYHDYYIKKNNGEIHEVVLVACSEFIDWIYWHHGSIGEWRDDEQP